MVDTDPKIAGHVDVLLDYRKGRMSLKLAKDRFTKLIGINPDLAESFLRGMDRENIIPLNKRRK